MEKCPEKMFLECGGRGGFCGDKKDNTNFKNWGDLE